MKIVSTKKVKQMQASAPKWLEGVDLNKLRASQYLRKYMKGDYYYWKKADSLVFEFENASTCISKKYFFDFFNFVYE